MLSLKKIYMSEEISIQEGLMQRLRTSQEKAEELGLGREWQTAYEKYRDDFNDMLTSIERADGVTGLKKSGAINEKAVTPKEASQQKLALHIMQSDWESGFTLYILYDAQKALLKAERLKKEYPPDETTINEALEDSILAIMHVTKRAGRDGAPSNGAHEVKASAAQDGYGPLMYDIVMSQVKTLMSDRDQVSGTAGKVWNYYFNNRPDIKKRPLDNVDYPKTPPKKDDGKYQSPKSLKNPLNWTYTMGRTIPITTLVNNDKVFQQQLAKLKLEKPMHFNGNIATAADKFFHDKYRH